MSIKMRAISLAAVAFLVLAGSLCAQSITEQQLSQYPVRFAILGDRTGGHVPGIHGQIVAEIERLKPDFVITVGDMIEGYTEDTTVINAEWEEYLALVKPLSMPIYYTPGNHDITTDAILEPYRRYIGREYYSFDHRGLHFVILDNSRWRYSRELPAEQIEWLIDDLRQNRDAVHTLVFIHKPFWYNTTALGKPDTLHSLFTNFGVDAVVTGHFHRYFTGVYDGVSYTCIGSSGGAMTPGPTGLGYHFGWVTVDDKEIAIVPVKLGSVLPWDEVSVDDLYFLNKIDYFGISFVEPLAVSEDLTVAAATLKVDIHNFHDKLTLDDTLRWSVPEGWSVEPESLPLTVAPQGKEQISFQVAGSANLYPVPALTVTFPFLDTLTRSVKAELLVARQVICRHATRAPQIDGKLTEEIWQSPQSQYFAPDGKTCLIDSTAFFFAYDNDNLYLAAHCHESKIDSLFAAATEHDGAVYSEDCVGYFIQPDINDLTVYQFYFNPLGTVFDQKITPYPDGYFDGDPDWNGIYDVKISRGDDFWEIEVRIPLAQLAVTAESGQKWRLNFRRKQERLESAGDWQVPIDYNPKTFGVLLLQ
ncbi:MAG: metallophosphoesterase [candidate division Zixibacteria bacterium]|nr:metallophosphoesterase [candidate division Zixibacteria bacterium]